MDRTRCIAKSRITRKLRNEICRLRPQGVESDFFTAIIRHEKTPQGGTLAAMVRTRQTDKITFRKSCLIRLTYKHDLGEPYNSSTRQGKAPALQPFVGGQSLDVPYRSCIYYYAAP